jgi:predicted nuclease with TOPRIM domain
LPDLSKYDLLLSELSAIETQLTILIDKYNDNADRNKELEDEVNLLKKENFSLGQKLNRFETQPISTPDSEDMFDSATKAEKEDLKKKIQNVITKIDRHLSS